MNQGRECRSSSQPSGEEIGFFLQIINSLFNKFREDKYDIVNILLKIKGVDPNIKDMKGDSLATVGVKKNNIEFLRRLNDIPGLDWNTKNKAGDSPLSLAVKQEQIEVLTFLKSLPEINLYVKDGQGQSLESIALSRKNNIEILKLLISYESMSDNLVLSAVIRRNLDFLADLKVRINQVLFCCLHSGLF